MKLENVQKSERSYNLPHHTIQSYQFGPPHRVWPWPKKAYRVKKPTLKRLMTKMSKKPLGSRPSHFFFKHEKILLVWIYVSTLSLNRLISTFSQTGEGQLSVQTDPSQFEPSRPISTFGQDRPEPGSLVSTFGLIRLVSTIDQIWSVSNFGT